MHDRIEAASVRKRQFLAPQFVRAMLAGHSALGLAFAALIYIVCLTGTVSVFMFDLQRWEQPDVAPVEQPVGADVVGAAVGNGQAQALQDNAAHDLFIMGPNARAGRARFLVSYHDHETGVEGHWLADADGKLVARAHAPWTEFVTELHMSLHLPRTWGLFLVGLTGVALLSSLISGLLSHPRLFKDAFHLRWGGSRRLQDADLHNRLGVWGLPFHFVVTLTGALLGLSSLIVGVLALAAYEGDSEKAFAAILGPHASSDETAAPIPDVAAMIRQVQAAKPDAEFTSINIGHIGKAGQVVHLSMRTPGHVALGNTYYFKGDLTPLGDGGLETGGVGQQILGVLQPLHFGWFGGTPIKLAYAVLGLALSVVTYTGVTIWLSRRRDKGRPARRWEKIWVGVGWGQPAALAASAVASFYVAEASVLYVYLVAASMALLVALLLPDAVTGVRVLRLACAASLVALPIAHGSIWISRIADPMAWFVNASLAIVAVVLVISVLPRRGYARAESGSLGDDEAGVREGRA
jgi:uncharacterized iron-regulated membrane protein